MAAVVAFACAIGAFWLALQLLVFVFKRRELQKTFERMQVPGPKPHFIHGHLYETRREPYVQYAHKMHEKYGKSVGVFLGGDPFLMTKDLELIRQVFVAKSRIFYDRMNFYLNVEYVPDNLICQRGDRWRYMRKLLTPAFATGKIRSSQFYLDAQHTARKFMQQLDTNSLASHHDDDDVQKVSQKRETSVDDVYDRMAAVALDVIVKTAFHMDDVISFKGQLSAPKGKPLQQQQQQQQQLLSDSDKFMDALKRSTRVAFNPLVELIFCFPFLDKPLTWLCTHFYFARIISLLLKRLDYLVRRASDKDGKPQDDKQQKRRIVDSLIEVLRERKITRHEFVGNAMVIVFAGFETTANALTFTLYLLAKNPRVQEKLRQQVAASIKDARQKAAANATDEELEIEELNELATGCEYLEWVINESLRLYPPVPGLSCRQASQACTLSNGMHIEQGVNVIPSVFSIHRDKEIWGDDASEFKPERFAMLDIAQVNSAMFMPFGWGPRNCIGKAVAMHEMKIFIGRFVQNYDIQPIAGETPEKIKLCSPLNITITPAHTIPLKFIKLAAEC